MARPDALKQGKYTGVFKVRVGYAGGVTEWPDYGHVADHTEATQIWYDGTKETYKKLLEVFFEEYSDNANRYHRKTQYQKKIWYVNNEQKDMIFEMAKSMGFDEKKLKPYVSPLGNFYLAEGYHQKYNLSRYQKSSKNWDFSSFQYVDAYSKGSKY